MTLPNYTATAGPADPKAPTRVKVWAGLAVLTPLLSALATFGVLSNDQASAINGAITAIIGLLGAFGFGFAAKKTNDQVHNGTFDLPPAMPPTPAVTHTPVTDAFDALTQLRAEIDHTITEAQHRAEAGVAAIQEATGNLPGLVFGSGNIGHYAPAVADLLRAMTDKPVEDHQNRSDE